MLHSWAAVCALSVGIKHSWKKLRVRCLHRLKRERKIEAHWCNNQGELVPRASLFTRISQLSSQRAAHRWCVDVIISLSAAADGRAHLSRLMQHHKVNREKTRGNILSELSSDGAEYIYWRKWDHLLCARPDNLCSRLLNFLICPRTHVTHNAITLDPFYSVNANESKSNQVNIKLILRALEGRNLTPNQTLALYVDTLLK